MMTTTDFLATWTRIDSHLDGASPDDFRYGSTAVVEHVTLESVYASNLTDETNSGWAGR